MQYVEKLCYEISQTPNLNQPLKTVFFGGGTPSLLAIDQLEQILTTLDRHFKIVSNAEISMEIDPGTFDLAQIQGYKAAGVNRVSLGVQAFQPEILMACGRTHTVEEVYQSIELIHQAGIENYSLDLISGLPHQTIEHWQCSIEKAIALAPTHLSTYDLTIEPQTPFGKQFKPGATPLPSDDSTAQMYRFARQALTKAGYEHYEISNYAKPGYQCQHNRVYWKNESFYGFGMGATSYVNGQRIARPRKTREYYDWIETMNPQQTQDLEPLEVMLDTLMVGLRLAEGIDLDRLTHRFGQAAIDQVWECLEPYYKAGWLERIPKSLDSAASKPRIIRLSDPEGFLFSNVVLVKLFETFEP